MPAVDPRRRRLLAGIAAAAATASWPLAGSASSSPAQLRARIPASGESIPAIGMGTWITFNVAPFTDARAQRVEVLRAFFEAGGGIVDSSPMYGLAEATLGHALDEIGGSPPLISATKVWIPTRLAGVAQMNASAALWGRPGFDLMQVHNMLDWQAHLSTLREWKGEGRIRYIGITTSHGRRHEQMLDVIEAEPDFDCVQFTYNIADREAEQRLLPAAADRGKAVIVNRPFRTGALFEQVRGKPLPPWAGEIGCASWAQFFLLFAISHPAVTCAIPATSRVDHLRENMRTLQAPLPDARTRQRMAQWFDAL